MYKNAIANQSPRIILGYPTLAGGQIKHIYTAGPEIQDPLPE